MKATTHDRFIVAAILIVMAALLWILPAQAQCDPSCRDIPEPPISSATSSTLYLPAMLNGWHAWFDDAELDAAMRTAGYDPAVASMHTNCYLDPSSTPPAVIRYTSCDQYYVRGVPTEGTSNYIWYLRMGNGVVTGLEVGP